ncbi:hypothetical protein BDV97DRAFT_350573 [Delphinella strobiligena]|nr:hypothetical protein BDV97DRAFT_350573 [Delphinella strobiligena]
MAPYLPDELLLQIFSRLATWESSPFEDFGLYEKIDEEGLKTLAILCQSSKRFRYIAEPILYGAFVKPENLLKRKKPNTLFQPVIHEPCCILRKYLRTLIERPDLANQVKWVQLQAWESTETLKGEDMWPQEASHEATPLPPSAQMAHSFYEAASKLLPEGASRTEWLIALCRGDEDAEVALLLALLPNVERLQVILPKVFAPDEYHFFFFHRILQQAISRQEPSNMHTFSRLKRLEARCYSLGDSDIGLPIYPFSTFFHLPQLEIFKGFHVAVEGDPNDWGEWSCPPGHSRVRSLQLKDSLMSSVSIATLVASCSSLQSLEVFFSTEETALEFRWPELGEALKRHQSSLESISIDIFSDSNLLLPPGEHAEPLLPSLKNFNTLRHLEIQQSGLTGARYPDREDESQGSHNKAFNFVDILPSSLESLAILNATPIIDLPLEALSRNLSHFPNLRKIRVASSDDFEPRHLDLGEVGKHQERIRPIRDLFEAAGIIWEEFWREPLSLDADGPDGLDDDDEEFGELNVWEALRFP